MNEKDSSENGVTEKHYQVMYYDTMICILDGGSYSYNNDVKKWLMEHDMYQHFWKKKQYIFFKLRWAGT